MALEDRPFWKALPEMPEHLDWVYRAFWDLNASRPSWGMGGVGPIPFEVLDGFAARMEVDDFQEFWSLIKAMDRIFLERLRERRGARG